MFYDTRSTVQQPCCCTMTHTRPENLALHRRSCDTGTVQKRCCTNEMHTRILHYTEDLVVRSPYSNHVAVQWNTYENLVLPRCLVHCRSKIDFTIPSPYSNHVAQWTYQVYENIALRYIDDLVIWSPYSNHVAVQWNVRENIVLHRSLVHCRSEVRNKFYDTITEPQPCCCTMKNVYGNLALSAANIYDATAVQQLCCRTIKCRR